MDRSSRLLLIIASLKIKLVSFNNDNNRSQTVSKWFCFGTVGQAGCHPKSSGFDELGIRLKNQLWQIKKGNVHVCEEVVDQQRVILVGLCVLPDAVMIFEMFH